MNNYRRLATVPQGNTVVNELSKTNHKFISLSVSISQSLAVIVLIRRKCCQLNLFIPKKEVALNSFGEKAFYRCLISFDEITKVCFFAQSRRRKNIKINSTNDKRRLSTIFN
jgi:hypothetical protein